MNGTVKFWTQVAGAALMAGLALVQGMQVMERTYDTPIWIGILGCAALYMVFEAWRTWRKMNIETNEN